MGEEKKRPRGKQAASTYVLCIGRSLLVPTGDLSRPSLLENTGFAQPLSHMLAGSRVGIPLQIPTRDFSAALRHRAHLSECAGRLFMAPEFGVARGQNKGVVRVRPDAASRRCGLDRVLVASQMIKHSSLVAEPG